MEKTEKPCRACTDFQSWAKGQRKTFDSEKKAQKEKKDLTSNHILTQQRECPLDRQELGRASWGVLHTIAAYYPEKPSNEQKKNMESFIQLFSKFYPCSTCGEDLKQQIKESPPQTDSQYALSQWFCKIHNEVNEKLGKPLFNCKLVNQRWRDGWHDGSCD